MRRWVCSRIAAIRKADDGAAIIEFALVAPVLLMMVFGVFEIGRFAHYNIVVESAARAGAQYGSQSPSNAADATGIGNAALLDAGDTTGLTLVPTPSTFCQCADASGTHLTCSTGICSTSHSNMHVSVTVSGTYTFAFWSFGVNSIVVARTVTSSVVP